MATKIRQSNLDNSIVTGLGELTSVASGDQTIIYDTSSGTLKKISQTNFLNFPIVTSVSPTSVTSGDGTGNYTFTITGSGFTGASANLINTSGTTVNFDTVTVDSSTQITGVIAKSSLPNSGEPYDVKVTASNNLAGTLENQINIDASPTFNTASGSLGTIENANVGSTTLTVEAFDPESAGNVTFELQSGSLPAGASIATVHENGVSKANISGFNAVGSDTTSNFVLRAVDTASNTSSRAFAITVNAPVSQSFTTSGTFSVPSGISSVDVLVVAGGGGAGDDFGGGGGAGGLIFMPQFPVTPGGTVSVTVGDGGGGADAGQGQPSARGGTGQDSVFGTLTAKGGGGGGGGNILYDGAPGGSGGGGSGHGTNPIGSQNAGGGSTQAPQPGNSGAYGFGNPGGDGKRPGPGSLFAGGGGGALYTGAIGCGTTPSTPLNCGAGGTGKAYTIADGTTPVYYAGGGAGAHNNTTYTIRPGGQGGGGNSRDCSPTSGQPGTANRGGGGGGNKASGGKGIVIVRY